MWDTYHDSYFSDDGFRMTWGTLPNVLFKADQPKNRRRVVHAFNDNFKPRLSATDSNMHRSQIPP